MGTNIIIHRGTNQIGGCVTEIRTQDHRIFIDYGESLPGHGQDEDVKVSGLTYEGQNCDGVLFTHYHGDHIGKFQTILPNVPLYMGQVTRQVMLNIHRTLDNKEALNILEDDSRIKPIKENEPLEFGDIRVTPYTVDHSAYDAYMFLIETPGMNILHTGDYRTHGYRGKNGKVLLDMIRYYILDNGRRNVDVLITEGTMITRPSAPAMSEREMQKKAADLFKEHKYAFLVCSSTNLDSLASFYHAAVDNGMSLYSNSYIKRQLDTFSRTAGQKSDLYKLDKSYVVQFDKVLKTGDTQEQHMRKYGFLMLVKEGERYRVWMERFKDLKPILIYSLWDGYIDPNQEAYNKDLHKLVLDWNGIRLHTGGHAMPDDIAKVIEAVNPTRAIIPMHTEKKEDFRQLHISEELKNKVVPLKDREIYG